VSEIETTSFAIIEQDGRVTDGYGGPQIGWVIPSAAFRGAMILCLTPAIVKAARAADQTGDER